MLVSVLWTDFMIHRWVWSAFQFTHSANVGNWVSASTTSEAALIKAPRAASKRCFMASSLSHICHCAGSSDGTLSRVSSHSSGTRSQPAPLPALYLEALLRSLSWPLLFSVNALSPGNPIHSFSFGNHPPRCRQSHVTISTPVLSAVFHTWPNPSLDIPRWILHRHLKHYTTQTALSSFPKPAHPPTSPHPNKRHHPHIVPQARNVTSCSLFLYVHEDVDGC